MVIITLVFRDPGSTDNIKCRQLNLIPMIHSFVFIGVNCYVFNCALFAYYDTKHQLRYVNLQFFSCSLTLKLMLLELLLKNTDFKGNINKHN